MHANTRNTLRNTFQWFHEAKPNPTPNDVGVQLGVHFEEVAEMLETITGGNQEAGLNILTALEDLKRLSKHMKENPELYYVQDADRKEHLDAICDQIVTASGSGYMQGMLVVDAMDEVNGSNWSKFVDGKAIFNEQGKIAKGPNYYKPNLSAYV